MDANLKKSKKKLIRARKNKKATPTTTYPNLFLPKGGIPKIQQLPCKKYSEMKKVATIKPKEIEKAIVPKENLKITEVGLKTKTYLYCYLVYFKLCIKKCPRTHKPAVRKSIDRKGQK